MTKAAHFLIARFFTRESKYRVNCKLCDYGLTYKLQSCARHVFDKCGNATDSHRQEVFDLLRETDDLDVLESAKVAAFHAQRIHQLQRQQAWREQQLHAVPAVPQLQELADDLQRAMEQHGAPALPQLHELADDIQQALQQQAAAGAAAEAEHPSKRQCRRSQRVQQQQQQEQQEQQQQQEQLQQQQDQQHNTPHYTNKTHTHLNLPIL